MRPNPSHPSPQAWLAKPYRKHISELTISDLSDISGTYQSAAAAVWHAVVLLEVALLGGRKGRLRLDTILVLRRDLPYYIHDTAYRGTQILLNRQYKPLGCNLPDSSTWVEYEDYPQVHVRLSAADIAKVVVAPYDRGLFGDGCQPWRSRDDGFAYLERIRRLHDLITRPHPERSSVG